MISYKFRIGILAAIATATLAADIGPMGADLPAREPQLAVNGSGIALAFGAGNSIYFTGSTDNGKTFSAPILVGTGPVILLSHHRGPRIVFAGSTLLITATVNQTAPVYGHGHNTPAKGDLLSWRSADDGKTWSSGKVVNDIPGVADEALHGLAAKSDGSVFAAWLDHRSGPPKLYGSLSKDGGLTWSPNVVIYASPDGTICQCCHPSVAFDREGKLLVMWRNWLGGSRDMYLVRSSNGLTFAPAEKLGTGTWKLNACPMDGGGIAISGDSIVTAWRRDHSIYLAQPGQPEIEIGAGTDVAVAATKKGAYAIWSTPAGLEIYSPQTTQPRSLQEKGSFPAIAALPNGHVVAAWENEGRITVRALD